MTTDTPAPDTRRQVPLRHAIYALLGMVGAFGLLVGVLLIQDREEDRRDDAVDRKQAQEAVDRDYSGCLRYNDTRLLMRAIITDVRPRSGPGLDLEALESYRNIDDPDVQDLLDLLTSPQPTPDDPSGLEKAYARTGTRPCEDDYPDHTPGIDLGTTVTVPPPPWEDTPASP